MGVLGLGLGLRGRVLPYTFEDLSLISRSVKRRKTNKPTVLLFAALEARSLKSGSSGYRVSCFWAWERIHASVASSDASL